MCKHAHTLDYPFAVKFEEVGEARSLSQNDMSFALYNEIAGKVEGETAVTVRRFCKLHFGVPIMRTYDGDYRALYDKTLKQSLSYEEKLMAMDYFPVTSLMKKKPFTEYIDAIRAHYAEHGVYLEAA